MWWDGMKYKEIISWVFVVIWMIIIYYLSSQSASESSLVSSGITDRVYQLLSNVFKNIEVLRTTSISLMVVNPAILIGFHSSTQFTLKSVICPD